MADAEKYLGDLEKQKQVEQVEAEKWTQEWKERLAQMRIEDKELYVLLCIYMDRLGFQRRLEIVDGLMEKHGVYTNDHFDRLNLDQRYNRAKKELVIRKSYPGEENEYSATVQGFDRGQFYESSYTGVHKKEPGNHYFAVALYVRGKDCTDPSEKNLPCLSLGYFDAERDLKNRRMGEMFRKNEMLFDPNNLDYYKEVFEGKLLEFVTKYH